MLSTLKPTDMKKHLYIVLVFMVVFASCNQSKNKNLVQRETAKPNIIIIMTDDQGYGDIGVYGATGFETPNLDILAKEGMRFTNFYAAQAVCTASRAGLITGCYPNRLGFPEVLWPHDTIGINPAELTIAEMLKLQGYKTACFGKWHLGWQKEFLPLQHGFDEFFGIPTSNNLWPNDDITGEKLPKSVKDYPVLTLIEGNNPVDSITNMKDQDRLTNLFTEKAVDFINRNRNLPFFIYVPHPMPHIPLGVSEKFRGKSNYGLYGDVMMEIDWSVGEIIKALEENGLTDNTIIIFTSDNGPWLNYGNHAGSAGGLREGKMTSWEGGHRVPFIIRWPATIPEGTICNKLACSIDLLPTFASITNGKLSDFKIDGVDLTSLLKGDFSNSPRETYLFYKGKELNAVRKGNWKLVLPHIWRSYVAQPGNDGKRGPRIEMTVPVPELYDLTRDPGEQYNVADSYPEKVNEIMIIVKEARRELGDLNIGSEKGEGTREIGHVRIIME